MLQPGRQKQRASVEAREQEIASPSLFDQPTRKYCTAPPAAEPSAAIVAVAGTFVPVLVTLAEREAPNGSVTDTVAVLLPRSDTVQVEFCPVPEAQPDQL